MEDKQAALAAIEGLEISDVLRFFYDRASERDKEIAELAPTDDEHEIDGAITSEGEDNGAFVLGWIWVDFAGTKFTKFCECCENETDKVTAYDNADGDTEYLCDTCLKEVTEDADAEV